MYFVPEVIAVTVPPLEKYVYPPICTAPSPMLAFEPFIEMPN